MSALGDTLLHAVDDGVSTITMRRPDAGNALLPEQRDAIVDLLAAASDDRTVRVVALRAEGRHFCTGADVGSIRDARSAEPVVGSGMRRIQSGAQRLIAAVLDCAKPVVAVVQGRRRGWARTSPSRVIWSWLPTLPTSSSRSCCAVSSWTQAARISCPASSASNGRRSSPSSATSSPPRTRATSGW
jgi:hypothetical protein